MRSLNSNSILASDCQQSDCKQPDCKQPDCKQRVARRDGGRKRKFVSSSGSPRLMGLAPRGLYRCQTANAAVGFRDWNDSDPNTIALSHHLCCRTVGLCCSIFSDFFLLNIAKELLHMKVQTCKKSCRQC